MSTYDETLSIDGDPPEARGCQTRTIRPNDHIQNDLGLDSLGVMEVIADVEDRFSVSIPNDALGDIATVRDIAKALVKLKS